MEILKAQNISKSFGEKQVLSDVNITLNKGEIVSLLGVSGAGKTTLFNILSGIYKADTGNVYLNSEDITGKPGKVSYMLQKDLLFPYRKVIDNVCLPLIINGAKKKEAREKALPLFKVFDIEGTEFKYPDQLSGGMRQSATVYTYNITNYKGYENRDCVYADLLVCSGELIGCDVYSTSVSNGFMQPLLGN